MTASFYPKRACLGQCAIYVCVAFMIVCAARFALFLFAPQWIGPRHEVVKAVHDFGTISSARQVRAEYDIRNVGTDDLHILGVKPSCSCAVVAGYPRTIRPGSSGRLVATFNAMGRRGHVESKIIVQTNDVRCRYFALTFRGDIAPDVTVAPPTLMLDQAADDYVVLKVTSRQHQFQFVRVQTPTWMSAEVECIHLGHVYHVVCRRHTDGVGKTGQIVFRTTHPFDKQIVVPVRLSGNKRA